MFFRNNKILKWGTSTLLVLSIIFISYGPALIQPQKAEAINYDPYNTIVNAGSWITEKVGVAYEFISSAALSSLGLKEWTLDGVAFAIVNIMIQNMSRSIISWINSGFQGSPAFVTDLEGFMIDIGDRAMGRFIEELGLGIMCSPFQLDVRFALQLQYQQARNFEINEMLGALFAQLVQQVFTGGGGLLGLTQSGYSSNGYSYLEAATAPEQSYVGYEDRSNDPIPQAIVDQEEWLALQGRMVSLINNAQLHDQNRWGEDCSNRPLPVALENARNDALDEITITEDTLTLLNDLQIPPYKLDSTRPIYNCRQTASYTMEPMQLNLNLRSLETNTLE